MTSDDSITILVAALNEEECVKDTILTAIEAAKRQFVKYEIIVFNDGSTDRTGEVAEELSRQHEHVQVMHHDRPHNRGGIYKEGISLARMQYVTMIDGTNDSSAETLAGIFGLRNKADIVVPYILNVEDRTLLRRIISDLFTLLCNVLFQMRLRYFNDCCLCKTHLLQSIDLKTDSYAFQAETLIKLIKAGCSYVEIGRYDNRENKRSTSAFRLKNLIGIGRFFIDTFWYIHCRRRHRQGVKPRSYEPCS